ncbi:biosynthetic-type acetolactate synthase large subunit [Candidatus Bathyarchaeota archaeon]|nr:biosynthetic-type acetolactate synthase large subunit [Candidatus Bathyarchaeota archaeon]
MTKMSGAQALIEALKREKVEVIFGIIGGATLPIYDVLRDSGIRHILCRHEQCAAHAADGYARASGRVGVCMATSGPGATNLVTGIATAYMDSSPIIALTGQANRFSANTTYMIGKDAFQEADIIGITTPITKYNFQVKEASEIPKAVKLAFYIATTGRPRPVLIDLPKDIQVETAQMEFNNDVKIRGYKPTTKPHPIQVKRAVELLLMAERPVIFAGGGVLLSNAAPELLALANFLMAPVAISLMGKGCFPENHPLSLGVVGMHGSPTANKLILEADVLLAVGVRFSDRTVGTLDEFCPDAKIIHIDIDSAEIGKNVDVDIPIVADAKRTLETINQQLIQRLKKQRSSLWFDRVQKYKNQLQSLAESSSSGGYINPQKLLVELRKILPEDTIVTTEVGQNQMWAALHFKALKPRTFLSSDGLGTMGFGFPAALGAKVACPGRLVVDIAGDGSFIMTSQDLACSVMEKIPVIVIVLNNSMLGMVAQWQRFFYNRKYCAVELGNSPDFVKLAEAYGAQGFRVSSLNEFSKAVRKAMKSDITTVIDVPISPEENVFPMIPPGKGLKDMITE